MSLQPPEIDEEQLGVLEHKLDEEHAKIKQLRHDYSIHRERLSKALESADIAGENSAELFKQLRALASAVAESNSQLDVQIAQTERLESEQRELKDRIRRWKEKETREVENSRALKSALSKAPVGEPIKGSNRAGSSSPSSTLPVPSLVREYFDALADEKLCEEVLFVDLPGEHAEIVADLERRQDQDLTVPDEDSLYQEYLAKFNDAEQRLLKAKDLAEQLRQRCQKENLIIEKSAYKTSHSQTTDPNRDPHPLLVEWLEGVSIADAEECLPDLSPSSEVDRQLVETATHVNSAHNSPNQTQHTSRHPGQNHSGTPLRVRDVRAAHAASSPLEEQSLPVNHHLNWLYRGSQRREAASVGFNSWPQPSHATGQVVPGEPHLYPSSFLPPTWTALPRISRSPEKQENAHARTGNMGSRPGFVVIRNRKQFFTVGKVFHALWSEPTAGDQVPNRSFEKIMHFVIIRAGSRSCTALSIVNYKGQGVAKPGVVKSEHVVIYTGDVPPSIRPEELAKPPELPMQQTPIRVIKDSTTHHLSAMSRLNLVETFTVFHNIHVKPYGKVHDDSLKPLQEQFRKAWGFTQEPLVDAARHDIPKPEITMQLQRLRSPASQGGRGGRRSKSQRQLPLQEKRLSVAQPVPEQHHLRSRSQGHQFRQQPPGFFIPGRVFGIDADAVLAAGTDTASDVTAFSMNAGLESRKIKLFVVIRNSGDSCSALPIKTYGRLGVSKPNVKKSDHAIIYTGKVAPNALESERAQRDEAEMQPYPIQVDQADLAWPLEEKSRLNLSKIYNIHHDQSVICFGQVSVASLALLESQWQSVFLNQSHEALPAVGYKTPEAGNIIP